MLYGWKGNRRLNGISTYGLKGLGKEDKHPAYTPHWSTTASIPFTFYLLQTDRITGRHTDADDCYTHATPESA